MWLENKLTAASHPCSPFWIADRIVGGVKPNDRFQAAQIGSLSGYDGWLSVIPEHLSNCSESRYYPPDC